MVGAKRSIKNVTDNEEENLSVPPGFVSLTSLKLKKIVTDPNSATERDRGPGLVGVPLRNSDLESFKMSLLQRPWISHGQFERVRHQDDSAQIGNNLKVPVGAPLPKGVIRGCENCHDCVKVTARWHPEDSYLPPLDDAPVFRPTEEEFRDTLKYIANIRPRAENYGICRIVPPPSWRPPCLLENKEIWEASKFSSHVQKIDGLQKLFSKRKGSRLHEKIETAMPKDAKIGKLDSSNECVGDSEEDKALDLVSNFESGPEFTLKSFKKYADDFKVQYFRENDTVAASGPKRSEPLIARVESEYWRIVEKPREEIEVLFGTEVANQTIASGFPVATTPAKGTGKYVKSGWNLNNTAELYGSLLPFGCYSSSTVSVPQIFIGMCFASECWRNEDHHLYSLSYMHMGSPKVWYSIPGKCFFKFAKVVKKWFPKLSKHPELLHEHVAQLSPSVLIAEGIPVFRCLQYPFEYVVTFPGAYHSKFSCGFNCSEAVCFAPIDWLPHGQNIIEHYAGYGFKTLLSHDKLLLGAAKEAVTYLWDSLTNKSSNSKIHFWRSACGADGTFTRLVKLRVENESIRRKHLCNMPMSRSLGEVDDATKRECCICLYDLYLSAVVCSCSPNRYSCLRHVKHLCSCGWTAKEFLFRYKIDELELLVEALKGNMKAIYSWAKNIQKLATSDKDHTRKNPNATSLCESNGLAA
ncbi:putative lysine-specific demethylase JMJ16 isoform X1 [Salvia hispanica]|uniref:putative lysine-specific demethylase JMJ16 isoform X1 n=1 Tax=Salvia hispanica TaxID=49212 RepID=UPI00200976FF|nr:putative lysine-specific demethylase JMJ16 isoform X1 [Salvia hispanica]XP_047981723.1 putative lysine-specific demethylase JMJ16 isoform X1 [Salvia hispanica]XP_047981724.1 putative lysine-specific demethylase JMJ16 isoform X1 [Salvia hispanica]XP_047981725.1 putative lysine-specific demethylase JMJ16 isoform X1 [Salvia hispanica]